MKVVGDFNKISPELKKYITLPKKGTVVRYKFLIGVRDFDNPNKINYPTQNIKTKDRIKDPFTGDFVDIGVFKEKKIIDGNETITTKKKWLAGGSQEGELALTIGRIEDDELYEFMELSNENESNPYRDTSVVPMFKRIDVVKNAVNQNKARSARFTALQYVESLDDAGIREFAAAQGWDENEEMEVLRNLTGEMADKTPDAFIAFVQDPEMKDKSLLKYAFTKEILRHDISTNKVYWTKSGTVLAQLERQDGKSYIDSLLDFILTNKRGGDAMTSIKKQIKLLTQTPERIPEPAE